jgi:hypothetical protein
MIIVFLIMTDQITKQDITDLFQRRDVALKKFDEDLSKLAQEVLDLIPSELNQFKEDKFYSIDYAIKFLGVLYENRDKDYWPANDKIKEPSDYGFTDDDDDVYQKMVLLKDAWKGLIDVKLDNSDWYLEVNFRLAK